MQIEVRQNGLVITVQTKDLPSHGRLTEEREIATLLTRRLAQNLEQLINQEPLVLVSVVMLPATGR